LSKIANFDTPLLPNNPVEAQTVANIFGLFFFHTRATSVVYQAVKMNSAKSSDVYSLLTRLTTDGRTDGSATSIAGV